MFLTMILWTFFCQSLKQKENASERALEQERSKVLQLKQDVIKVKEQRARDVLNHQTEIEELLS